MLDPIERVITTMNPVRRAGRFLTYRVASASGSQPQVPTETVDIACTTTLLTAIAEAADTIPAVDQARIVHLQEAVASGTLRANPQQIAQSVIALDALLFGRGRNQPTDSPR
jgi:flagellar biosynthesis anti-sigma factor FlgM